MSRDQDYISIVRQHARNVWESSIALLDLQHEWNALDYGSTLEPGEGSNAGITSVEVGAAVFATTDEIKLRILDTGHATNLAKLL